jgi:hypothetical protein
MRAFFDDSAPAGSTATPPARIPDLPPLSPRARSGSGGLSAVAPSAVVQPGAASVVGALHASLEALVPVHTAFLKDLQAQTAAWTETAPVGTVFQALAARLDVYVPYAARYDGALAAIADAQQRQPRVRALLEAAAELRRVRRLDVGAFLIMPIQRLPRYGLLLRDLLRYTWDTHPDRAALADALARVQAATAALNEARRREEARRRTQAVLDRFTPSATAASAQLRDSDVVCLHEGLVAAVHVTGKGGAPAPPVAGGEGVAGSKRALLLFSDQLILSVRARRSVVAQVRRLTATAPSAPRALTDATALPLATLVTAAVDVDDRRLPQLHGFAVATEHAVYRFFVASAADRDDWMARINAARTALG